MKATSYHLNFYSQGIVPEVHWKIRVDTGQDTPIILSMNIAHSPVAYGRLAHLGILRFRGLDALNFLQGQLSNDIRLLTAGQSLLAAYSSPQGRVLAVLNLLAHASGVIAILPSELVQPTRERLQKFVLRAKVQIDDLTHEWSVTGQMGNTAGPGASNVTTRLAQDPSRAWSIANTVPAKNSNGAKTNAEQFARQWRLQDIRMGIPQIYHATSELFVAQMLNLDLINGISFTKGCFTGQEIIARTQHLGRIKRRMYRLQFSDESCTQGSCSIGQSIRLPDGRSGRIIEVIATPSGFEALAVLNLAAVNENPPGIETTRIDAEEMALPYSLP